VKYKKEDSSVCKGCIYSNHFQNDVYLCDYILMTKQRRPCPPGTKCTVRVEMSAIKARVNRRVDRAEVVRLRVEERLKIRQIAEVCGCTEGYISRVLREEKEKQKTA
jgi:hypothetical protein